jgi:hypothetical protein
MPRFGQQATLLNQLLIGTEGYVLHTNTVYTEIVYHATRLSFPSHTPGHPSG